MIVSHRHKFIYLKTIKTASSSMESLLSGVCGPDDIVTPTKESLMIHRSSVKAQNYALDHPMVPKRRLYKRLLRRPERYYHPSVGYYEHMPAWRVRAYLGETHWNEYFKFTFERNPWDRQVSFYHYRCRDRARRNDSFEEFMEQKRRSFVDNWNIYTMDGEVVVDFLGRYESLEDDFTEIKERLGLPADLNLPEVNKSSKTTTYHNYYNDYTRELVEQWYANEISECDYRF